MSFPQGSGGPLQFLVQHREGLTSQDNWMLSLKGVPWTVATALSSSLFLRHMVCHHGFSSSIQKNDVLSKCQVHCSTRFLEPQTADSMDYAPNTPLLHTTLVTALSATHDGNLPHVQPIFCQLGLSGCFSQGFFSIPLPNASTSSSLNTASLWVTNRPVAAWISFFHPFRQRCYSLFSSRTPSLCLTLIQFHMPPQMLHVSVLQNRVIYPNRADFSPSDQ